MGVEVFAGNRVLRRRLERRANEPDSVTSTIVYFSYDTSVDNDANTVTVNENLIERFSSRNWGCFLNGTVGVPPRDAILRWSRTRTATSSEGPATRDTTPTTGQS